MTVSAAIPSTVAPPSPLRRVIHGQRDRQHGTSGTTSPSMAPPPPWCSASYSSPASTRLSARWSLSPRMAWGSWARPLGGALFGHFGDRVGRKAMLSITVIIMGAGTFLIGCLPTYGQWGIAAPILLIILRLVQGVGIGGEWGRGRADDGGKTPNQRSVACLPAWYRQAVRLACWPRSPCSPWSPAR